MTTIIHSNGSKWIGESLDSIDQLIEVLASHTLDPKFEQYGCFVQTDNEISWPDGSPDHWTPAMYQFFGNFLELSHVFRIDSDDPDVKRRLCAAIHDNRQTDAYKAAAE